MLAESPATEADQDELFNLMMEEARSYIDASLALMGASREVFRTLFGSVGRLAHILEDGDRAGFYWIEEREQTLHIHALILRSGFQGRGIGGQVLQMLADAYRDRVGALELGVHESNVGARRLYDRFGFKVERELPELGFVVMRKHLGQVAEHDGGGA